MLCHGKKHKEFKLLLWICFLVGFFGVFSNAKTVSAESVYDTIPIGLSADDLVGYENVSSIGGRPSRDGVLHYSLGSNLITNDINGVRVSNNSFNPISSKTGILSFWGVNNRQGAIWSNDKNMMDIQTSHTYSMWICMPYSAGLYDSGIAFVLQNDPNGINALATASDSSGTKSLAAEETLGVWATDTNPIHLLSAIQNSWALELDTYGNTGSAINNAFDNDTSLDIGRLTNSIHLASNYPAEASTYNALGSGAYSMIHNSPAYHVMGGTTDVMWHHFSITYNPNNDGKTANITYKFNDKNPDGTPNNNTGVETMTNPLPSSNTVKIDLSKFNLTDGNTKLRWGLVGRGDGSKGNMMISFEKVSVLTDADIDSKIIDTTQDNRVLTADYNEVNAGDELSLQYDLTYNGGQEKWENIAAELDIPNDVTITSGSIIFKNGNTEAISTSEITAANTNRVLKHTISPWDTSGNSSVNALTKVNDTAVLTLRGTTPDHVTSDIYVPSSHAAFRSSSYVDDTNLIDFIIRNRDVREINMNDAKVDPANISTLTATTLTGNLTYADGTDFESSGADLYINVDGTDLEPMNFKVDDNKKKIDFAIPFYGSNYAGTNLPAQQVLGEGTHTIKVYAKDRYNNQTTPTQIFTINVDTKSASLEIEDSNFYFADVQGIYKGIVSRKGDWGVNVVSVNSPWSLSVSATSLSNAAGKTFDGAMIYKDDNRTYGLGSSIPISQSTAETETATTSITSSWNDDDGILLDSFGGTESGLYTGVLSWELSDAPH